MATNTRKTSTVSSSDKTPLDRFRGERGQRGQERAFGSDGAFASGHPSQKFQKEELKVAHCEAGTILFAALDTAINSDEKTIQADAKAQH